MIDRLITNTNQLGNIRTRSYDNVGNLTQITNRNGRSGDLKLARSGHPRTITISDSLDAQPCLSRSDSLQPPDLPL
ncbi:RHS repeat domain-containing protein [Chamaesiphon sp.]|uniref:RHS repeat domain-containing protein n=1 Tax=Chamaesiphon sp. TaxID=2814140 RepID=UPI0035944D47